MNTLKHKFKITTTAVQETLDFGKKLAVQLKPGNIVCLVGQLGAGKTCLVQGMAKGLRVRGYVNSPTFKLINEYRGRYPLYHFDLYRLESFPEIQELGYEEYLYGKGISVIEWAEKIIPYLPKTYLLIEMKWISDTRREIAVTDWRPKTKIYKPREAVISHQVIASKAKQSFKVCLLNNITYIF